MLIRNVVPPSLCVLIYTKPFSREMLVWTTSIPTPRPLNSVATSTVVNPGWKIRWMAASSVIRSASSAVTSPLSTAFRFTRSMSIPRPSSYTWMRTWVPFWEASIEMTPRSFFPLALRTSGGSIP